MVVKILILRKIETIVTLIAKVVEIIRIRIIIIIIPVRVIVINYNRSINNQLLTHNPEKEAKLVMS